MTGSTNDLPSGYQTEIFMFIPHVFHVSDISRP